MLFTEWRHLRRTKRKLKSTSDAQVLLGVGGKGDIFEKEFRSWRVSDIYCLDSVNCGSDDFAYSSRLVINLISGELQREVQEQEPKKGLEHRGCGKSEPPIA
jgi:hypothetical protein